MQGAANVIIGSVVDIVLPQFVSLLEQDYERWRNGTRDSSAPLGTLLAEGTVLGEGGGGGAADAGEADAGEADAAGAGDGQDVEPDDEPAATASATPAQMPARGESSWSPVTGRARPGTDAATQK